MIFNPKFFGLPNTPRPTRFALSMAAEQPTDLTNVKVVFFRENGYVAILAADSKRSF